MNKLLILPILMFLGNYLLAQEIEPIKRIEPPQNVGQNVGQDPGAIDNGGEQWGAAGPPVPEPSLFTEQPSCLPSKEKRVMNEEGAEGQKCEDGDS